MLRRRPVLVFAFWFLASAIGAPIVIWVRAVAGEPNTGDVTLALVFSGGAQYYVLLTWIISTLPFAGQLFLSSQGDPETERPRSETGAFLILGILCIIGLFTSVLLGLHSREQQELLAGTLGHDPVYEYPADRAVVAAWMLPFVWFACLGIVAAALRVDEPIPRVLNRSQGPNHPSTESEERGGGKG